MSFTQQLFRSGELHILLLLGPCVVFVIPTKHQVDLKCRGRRCENFRQCEISESTPLVGWDGAEGGAVSDNLALLICHSIVQVKGYCSIPKRKKSCIPTSKTAFFTAFRLWEMKPCILNSLPTPTHILHTFWPKKVFPASIYSKEIGTYSFIYVAYYLTSQYHSLNSLLLAQAAQSIHPRVSQISTFLKKLMGSGLMWFSEALWVPSYHFFFRNWLDLHSVHWNPSYEFFYGGGGE